MPTLDELYSNAAGAPVVPGNIDLGKRPVVKNADGTISTVRSMGVNIDGQEVLIPTVSDDGRIMGDDEAISAYQKTGRHLGKFSSVAASNAYAERLHQQQAEKYGAKIDQDLDGLYDAAKNPNAKPNMLLGVGANPDQEAEKQRLAKRYNIPADLVDAFGDDYKQRAKLDDANAAMERAPALRSWIAADGARAKVAHDDVDNMSALERVWYEGASAVRTLASGVPSAVGGVAGMAEGISQAKEDISARVRQDARDMGRFLTAAAVGANAGPLGMAGFQVEPDIRPAGPQPATATDAIKAFRKGAEQVTEDVAGPLPEDAGVIRRGVRSGIQSIGQQAPGIAASIATGNPAFALLSAGVTTAGQSTAKALDAGLSGTRALAFGAIDGAIEVATEKLPVAKLLGDLKAGSSFMKTIMHQMVTEIPGEQVATLAQDFNEWATLHPEKPFSAYAAERPAAAIETLIATIVGTGAQTGAAHALAKVAGKLEADPQKLAADKAAAGAQALDEIDKLAQASKVRERSADDWQSFWQEVARDGPVKDVYVDARDLDEAALRQLVEVSPAAAQQAAESLASGVDIQIPAAEFGANVAGQSFAQGIIPHLKTDPNGMSKAQADVVMKDAGPDAEKALSEALAKADQQDAQDRSRNALAQQFIEQLNATGRFTPDVNKQNAALLAARYAALGSRLGVTPEQAFQQYPVNIAGTTPTGGALEQSALSVSPGTANTFTLGSSTIEYSVSRDGGRIDVSMIRTPKEARRQGGARKALGAVVAAADANGQQVVLTAEPMEPGTSKAKLEKFYKSLGFKPNKGRSKDFTTMAGMVREPSTSLGSLAQSTTNNASGESAAGMEAQSRLAQERAAGQVCLMVDKSGAVRPLIGVDAVDTKARAGQVILQRGVGAKEWTVLSQGDDVKASAVARARAQAEAHAKSLNQKQGQAGPAGPQAPALRGTYTPDANTIALLADANFSTLIHESGHLFLDQMGAIAARDDAPADIKTDMETVLDWFGIKAEEGLTATEVWNSMPLEQQREHHEKFARGFEAYAFEGKAPSSALAGAFQRFRGWLRRLYRSMTALDVKLSDEVRAVMDRMIATDDEIAQAKAAQSMGLMFNEADAKKLGLDYRAYQNADADADADAETTLDKRRLNDLKWLENAKSAKLKELQREAADKRREVKAEARSIVMARPVYRAWAFLTGKSGEAVVPGVTDVELLDTTASVGKLRTSAMKEMFGDSPGAAWRKLEALRMTQESGGMHPDIVAELFGYDSGEALVDALRMAMTPAQAVEAQTDAMMMERYGDIANPEELAQAALEAVSNDARARVLATELGALEKAAGTRTKTVTKAAKAFAAQVVGWQKVGELRPEKFEAAARKAAIAANKAFKAGDIAKAATEKRNELVNVYAAAAARDAQALIKRKVDVYRRAANKSIKEVAKTRDADMVQAMRAILADYGIGTKGEPAMKYLEALKGHDPDSHARMFDAVAQLTADAKDYKLTTVDEFRALTDELDVWWAQSRRVRQMEIDGNLIDQQEAAEEVAASLAAEGVPGRIPGEGYAVTPAETVVATLRSARAGLRRVESWVNARDLGHQGAFRKYVFNPIKDAADKYRAAQAAYRKRYLALLDKLDLGSSRIEAKELGYTFGRDTGGSGKQEIIHAILHTGNDSNKRKLLLGRRWATQNADGTLDTTKWDAFLKRMHDTGVIGKAEYDFAQGVWDLLEEMKAEAQKTHREVFGRSFDEITANEVVTPFGTYRGGYVPAMADPRAVSDAKTRAIIEEENQTMAQAYPSTSKGFTKGRVEYNKALLLDLRSLSGHLDKVLMFTHMERPVREVRRLLGDSSVREPLSRMDPSAYDGMLIPWLNRAARQQIETPVPAYNGLMRYISIARSRAGMAAMFANVVNAAQQITGFGLAALRVKPKHLRAGLVQYLKNPSKTAKSVAEASSYMSSRMDSEVHAMNSAIDEILLNPNVFQKAQAWAARHAYFMQSAVDNVMGPIIWTGAYNEAMEAGVGELDARRQADSVVRETQGSNLPEDISNFEAGTAITRVLTQFQGYFNMQANLLGTEFAKTQRELGLRAGMGRGLYVFTMGFFVPALISEVIVQAARGGPADDDGDGYIDDWLASLGLGLGRSAWAMVPIVGPVANVAINSWNNKPYDDRVGTAPAISMIERAAHSPRSVYDAVAGEGSARKAVKDVAALIAVTVGLPAPALARPLGYLADVAQDRVTPTGPADAVRGSITGVPSPQSKQ